MGSPGCSDCLAPSLIDSASALGANRRRHEQRTARLMSSKAHIRRNQQYGVLPKTAPGRADSLPGTLVGKQAKAVVGANTPSCPGGKGMAEVHDAGMLLRPMAPRPEASLPRVLIDHIIVAPRQVALCESFPSRDQLDETGRSAW